MAHNQVWFCPVECNSSPDWQIEAKRKLAVWKQHVSVARTLAHGSIVVNVPERRGVKIHEEGSGLKEYMKSPSFMNIQLETAKEIRQWDEKMEVAEELAYSTFLIDAAKKAGVDVEGIVKLSMMDKHIIVRPALILSVRSFSITGLNVVSSESNAVTLRITFDLSGDTVTTCGS